MRWSIVDIVRSQDEQKILKIQDRFFWRKNKTYFSMADETSSTNWINKVRNACTAIGGKNRDSGHIPRSRERNSALTIPSLPSSPSFHMITVPAFFGNTFDTCEQREHAEPHRGHPFPESEKWNATAFTIFISLPFFSPREIYRRIASSLFFSSWQRSRVITSPNEGHLFAQFLSLHLAKYRRT